MKAAVKVIARALPDEPHGFQMKVEIETWEHLAPLILTRRTRLICTSEIGGVVTVVFDPIAKPEKPEGPTS